MCRSPFLMTRWSTAIRSQPLLLLESSNKKNYVPNGGTALLDAIGESVMNLKLKIADEVSKNEATAVVVILTDGEENSSKVFTWDTVRKMISELERTGAWTFSFLGATMESVKAASRISIPKRNTVQFDKDDILNTYNNLNASLTRNALKKEAGTIDTDFFGK
jgi:hypothetical protein